jgi:hypothetical protein
MIFRPHARFDSKAKLESRSITPIFVSAPFPTTIDERFLHMRKVHLSSQRVP